MYAEIALPKTNLDTLTYRIPEDLLSYTKPGALVRIELRKKKTNGIVIETNQQTSTINLKDIIEVLDTQFLPPDLLSLLRWAKKYYFSKWAYVLNLTLPQSVYKAQTTDREPLSAQKNIKTNDIQAAFSIKKIIVSLKNNQYKTFLFFNSIYQNTHEIYLQLITETLKLKKSAIVLVPEIILTPKYINQFQDKFGDYLFCYHSGIKLSERNKIWHALRNTDQAVVLGTRSAIFAPVKNLGLIIVDNEHDQSYKEIERHFHYNARDIAIVRAQQSKAVAVLKSSTPSCESFYNTKTDKYELISIPDIRIQNSRSRLFLIDMRRGKEKILSPKLKYEIQNAYHKNKQIVLFLNRRGYARVISCADCGYIPTCPQCAIPLTLHNDKKTFICHTCKYTEGCFDYCPQCKGNDFIYQGIGTQKVEAEIKKFIRNPDILRLDSDSTKNSQTHNSSTHKLIITTRLGLRGLDYSQIGLFGIISADTTLFLPDFRAQERTFQELSKIIEQCSINKDCKVLIQTYHPDNYAIYRAVQGDYLKFFEQELQTRKKLNYPPYVKLVLIKITSSQKNEAEKITDNIMRKLSQSKNLACLGPNLAQVTKPKTYTYQILIKMKPNTHLSNLINLEDLASDKVKVDIDIDPM